MNKIRRNSIIIFIISIFLIWYVLKDNFNESLDLLFSSNFFWIFMCLVTYLVYFVLEAIVLKKMINKYKKDYSFYSVVKLNVMTRFFNGITPFASGGQPLQVYELNKEGVKITDGTIITVEHFIVFQTSVVILALISVILNTIFEFVKCEPFLNNLVIIGFILNIALLILVYVFSISKSLNNKIISFFVKILSKLKIVKNREKTLEKMHKACDEYYYGYKELNKNPKEVWKLIALEILALVVWFIMPMFIFKAIGYIGKTNILICTLISIYVFFVGSYIPVPGGSGGMEYAFMGYFSYYIDISYLSSALLLWRFINYYLPMIVGGLVFNFSKRKEKNKKLKEGI